jgi:hypothetical protein
MKNIRNVFSLFLGVLGNEISFLRDLRSNYFHVFLDVEVEKGVK